LRVALRQQAGARWATGRNLNRERGLLRSQVRAKSWPFFLTSP